MESLGVSEDSVPLTYSMLSLRIISQSELDCVVVEGLPDAMTWIQGMLYTLILARREGLTIVLSPSPWSDRVHFMYPDQMSET